MKGVVIGKSKLGSEKVQVMRIRARRQSIERKGGVEIMTGSRKGGE